MNSNIEQSLSLNTTDIPRTSINFYETTYVYALFLLGSMKKPSETGESLLPGGLLTVCSQRDKKMLKDLN